MKVIPIKFFIHEKNHFLSLLCGLRSLKSTKFDKPKVSIASRKSASSCNLWRLNNSSRLSSGVSASSFSFAFLSASSFAFFWNVIIFYKYINKIANNIGLYNLKKSKQTSRSSILSAKAFLGFDFVFGASAGFSTSFFSSSTSSQLSC